LARQITFVSVELDDFRQFRGHQVFDLARAAEPGASALTVITGGGGFGKTSLVTAMRLALWGAKALGRHSGVSWHPWGGLGDAFADPARYINADSLRRPPAEARVRLTLKVEPGPGGLQAAHAVAVTRSWRVAGDGRAAESVAVEVREGIRAKRLERGTAQHYLNELLPPGHLPHLFSNGEQAEVLGRFASIRPPVSELAGLELEALSGGFARESWRKVAPAVIAFANRLLAARAPGDDELWLLPESAGRRWPGAYPVVPGVWVSREPTWGTHFCCIGHALSVGLHLSGETRAPLVLDAPGSRMEPRYAAAFLDAMAEVAGPQVVVLDHEGQIDELSPALWARAHRIYLVWDRTEVSSGLLSEPAQA
jgi:hypothetical protein